MLKRKKCNEIISKTGQEFQSKTLINAWVCAYDAAAAAASAAAAGWLAVKLNVYFFSLLCVSGLVENYS